MLQAKLIAEHHPERGQAGGRAAEPANDSKKYKKNTELMGMQGKVPYVWNAIVIEYYG